jgi:adenine-specific DNA-methyltransferase
MNLPAKINKVNEIPKLNPGGPTTPTPVSILTEQLRQLVPDAFEDGEFNPSVLSQLLAEEGTETVSSPETFGLNWTGKKQARRIAMKKAEGALKPVPGEGVDEETTQHTFIEGDNLSVLKLLRDAYADRVKMIYIDPPYNTGNDFIYNDDFSEPIDAYLKRTGEKDGDQLLVSNPKSSGRFHSNWLNFIYPRLRVAKDLLMPEGVIFVSIDDNEVHNLKNLMNEIFGEERFIGQLIWKSRNNKDNRNVTGLSIDHEYILCYGNKIQGSERKLEQYQNPDKDPRGDWTSANMVGLQPQEKRPNLHYDLIDPETNINYGRPTMGWRYEPATMAKLISEKKILWPKSPEGRPRRKLFLSELTQEFTGFATFVGTGIYTNDGTQTIKEIFGDKVFDFPKPVELIKEIIPQGLGKEDGIFLDFFAGSGSSIQAILEYNAETNSKHKFIGIQIDEKTPVNSIPYRENYFEISAITKERIRRVSATLKTTGKDSDLGFKVYRLDISNFRPWKDFQGTDMEQLEISFERSAKSPLVDNWKPTDLLIEIMLMEGFPLHSQINDLTEYAKNKVMEVTSDFCEHRLMVCLDEKIHPETVAALKVPKDDILICLDSALTDQVKLALYDRCKIKTI